MSPIEKVLNYNTMGSFNPLFGLVMSSRHNLKKFNNET